MSNIALNKHSTRKLTSKSYLCLKKYMFRSFLINFVRPKTCDKDFLKKWKIGPCLILMQKYLIYIIFVIQTYSKFVCNYNNMTPNN